MSSDAAPTVASGSRPAGRFRIFRRVSARIGLLLTIVFLLLTILAPAIAPYDPYDQDLSSALSPPSAAHWLGADQYGRDVLSRVLYGTRTALLAVVVADGLALVVGCTLGLIAGFFGGSAEAVIMRLVDVLLAFP
jgi:peptide/nickel transport system permease protein